ncbi:hypothetical protein [Pilimelia columellifera]|uniref:Methyl-accepting chemotaxis protein n=1 Tax=Pilimelia columellifera subsp. columellifera TaxID=706583 RepID=A0ABN3NG52_9ACTN
MKTIGGFLRDRPIAVKLGLVTGIALASLAVTGVVAAVSLDQATDRALTLQSAALHAQAQMEADMAHDAVSSDLLRVIVATNAAERQSATEDLSASSEMLRDKLVLFRSTDVSPSGRSPRSRR